MVGILGYKFPLRGVSNMRGFVSIKCFMFFSTFHTNFIYSQNDKSWVKDDRKQGEFNDRIIITNSLEWNVTK